MYFRCIVTGTLKLVHSNRNAPMSFRIATSVKWPFVISVGVGLQFLSIMCHCQRSLDPPPAGSRHTSPNPTSSLSLPLSTDRRCGDI